MKLILGTMVILLLLVGCQNARSIKLPTMMTPHVTQQEAPASLYLEQPEEEPMITSSDDPVISTVLKFRQACLDKKAFWIKIKGRTEQFTCELVE